MTKRDYQIYMREYISSLESSGTIGTAEQWHTWIREDTEDYYANNQASAGEEVEKITDEEIDWIIEVLENEGYVIKEV